MTTNLQKRATNKPGLLAREVAALKLLRKHSSRLVPAAEMARHLGVTVEVAKRALRALRQQGKAEPLVDGGSGKSGGWSTTAGIKRMRSDLPDAVSERDRCEAERERARIRREMSLNHEVDDADWYREFLAPVIKITTNAATAPRPAMTSPCSIFDVGRQILLQQCEGAPA